MSLNYQERLARQPYFDPKNIGVGGPIVLYQHCSFVSDSYRKGYDQINWQKKKKQWKSNSSGD